MAGKRLVRFFLATLLGFLLSYPLAWVGAQTPQQAYQQGDLGRAEQLLQQALKESEQRQDYLQQAQILAWLALTLQKQGRWPEAEAAINSGFDLARSQAVTPAQTAVHAQIFNAKGTLELNRGRAEAALAAWQAAEGLYQKNRDPLGMAGSQLNQAQAWETLGFFRRSCNTALQALGIVPAQCEQISPAALEAIAQQPPEIALIGFRSLGNFLRLLGKFTESQTFLAKSLELARAIPSPQEESKALLSLGNTQQVLGVRARELNQPLAAANFRQKALNYYQQAANLAKSAPNSPNLLLLLAHVNQFHLEQAAELIPLIEAEIAAIPPSRTSIYAQVNFVQALAALEAPSLSTAINEHLERAIQQARSLPDPQAESYALGTLGQFTGSPDLLEQALFLAQSQNAPEIAYRWQWQLGRIYRQQGRGAEALAAYQAAFDTLQVLRSDLVALSQEVQFSFREQVEPVYREYSDLLLAEPEPEHLKQARETIEALQIAQLDNYFQDVCSVVARDSIEGIDPHAAIFYTIILPERLEVILSLPDGRLVSHSTPIRQEELERELVTLRNYLQEPDRLRDLQPIAQKLYGWLIDPLLPQVQQYPSVNTLVFVLDGALQNLPMGVLYDGQNYLAQKYAIALTPSLQLLRPKGGKGGQNVLIAGVSESQTVDGLEFSPLENVPREWNILQNLLSGDTLLNTQFTKSNLQKSLADHSYSIVHIATHGQFSSDPEKTYLLLWNQLLNVKDWDGLFQLRNRQQSGLIDLLVLSACETANGDKRAALGLAGVAIRTGARSTLATLWQVNDEATYIFMENFYRILNANPQLTKAESLQKAQLELMQVSEKDWQVPYFWASYVLVGNWL